MARTHQSAKKAIGGSASCISISAMATGYTDDMETAEMVCHPMKLDKLEEAQQHVSLSCYFFSRVMTYSHKDNSCVVCQAEHVDCETCIAISQECQK